MNIPKLIVIFILFNLSCQKDKLEPTLMSITDIVTVEPQKTEYNIGDTIWFSNHTIKYLVEKTSNDTFLKEDGDIIHYVSFLKPLSDVNLLTIGPNVEPINGVDYKKISANQKESPNIYN